MSFDVAGFLGELDASLGSGEPGRAWEHLTHALAQTEHDGAARLTVLAEVIGFLRSVGRHGEAVAAAEESVALAERLGVTETEAFVATLINAATANRAAGRLEPARELYDRALEVARSVLAPGDRRFAALHNNRSILFSDAGEFDAARAELVAALGILRGAGAEDGLEVADTCTNLALVCFRAGATDEGREWLARSLAIYRGAGFASSPHAAAALAAQGESLLRAGEVDDAEASYREALAILERCYGRDSDAYRVTSANLDVVRGARGEGGEASGEASEENGWERAQAPARARARAAAARSAPPEGDMTGEPGLAVARAYWQRYAPDLLAGYPALAGRVAAGLVGHGSECYGFDDAASRDHDFGPGFCLWLTPEDYAAYGERLQADYERLPATFGGVGPREDSPRARGTGRRVGVFEIGAFYAGLTGYADAPAPDRAHEWLALEESTLAAAANGAIFADPLGAFSGVRGRFRHMPKDVRLALISRRLGMAAQAGQYNVPRMLARGDAEAAWTSVGEFVAATASLVFLLNGPARVGYLPYYKWRFAAMRRLSARMGSRLPEVTAELEAVLRVAGPACFSGDGAARTELSERIERICAAVAGELVTRGLSRSSETFLEWQRPYVEEGIEEPWLKSL